VVDQIKNCYDRLEVMREPLRAQILKYHESKKAATNPDEWNVPDPPMLSFFESVKPVRMDNGEIKFQVKAELEPLLFRSAIRSRNRALEAKKRRDNNPNDQIALIDEIENSVACIVSSTNCLESYINHVMERTLPVAAKLFEASPTLPPKWLFVPAVLGTPNLFKPSDFPFSDFVRLVRLRNAIIHYKPTYSTVKGINSKTVSEYNSDNATLALKVVSAMVTELGENSQIGIPS
jgi:hypothetical protein